MREIWKRFIRLLKPTTTEISAPLSGRDLDDKSGQANHSESNLCRACFRNSVFRMGLKSPYFQVERLRHIHCPAYRRSGLWRESESSGSFRRDKPTPLESAYPILFPLGWPYLCVWLGLTRKLSKRDEARLDSTERRIAPHAVRELNKAIDGAKAFVQ